MQTTHPTPAEHATHSGVSLRPIPGYEGRYAAGDDGHIYSLLRGEPYRLRERVNPETRVRLVNLYHPDIQGWKSGYRGKRIWGVLPITSPVHLLIAAAWLGPKPGADYTIDHATEDRGQNRPDQIAWMTPKQNWNAYLERHPEANRGENNPRAKLTMDAVISLRALQGRMSQRAAGALYGITQRHVGKIWRRELWKHLP